MKFVIVLTVFTGIFLQVAMTREPEPMAIPAPDRMASTASGMLASVVKKPPFKRGYCQEDPNNRGWYILKILDLPGWAPKDRCYATDFTVTSYGQKPCLGGTLEQCRKAARDLYLGMPAPVKR